VDRVLSLNVSDLYSSRHLVVLLVVVSLTSCAASQKSIGIPSDVQATIDSVIAEMAADQVEKIYWEADDEWRKVSSLEETKAFFKTLKTKLGKVTNRVFHSARGEQNVGGVLPVQSFVVQYQSSFERGEGMETFTLVQRNGRWLLARYFVNSESLRQ
jgi:Protein of unknown function (DUF4019)